MNAVETLSNAGYIVMSLTLQVTSEAVLTSQVRSATIFAPPDFSFSQFGFLMVHTTLAQNSPQDFLDPHNAARAAVGVGPMQWDETVANYAMDYANKRSRDCVLQHSGGQYGENIYGGPVEGDFNAKDAVKSWVDDEKQFYDYKSNSCVGNNECHHYTQVVWRDSIKLGCAWVKCSNVAGTFITCNYDPPGNYPDRKPY